MSAPKNAYLTNRGEYTVFTYGDRSLTFLTSKSLERYTQVKEWDIGYLVVMAKYKMRPEEEEEYIDLIPILENLYMDPESFLKPIQSVEVRNV